MTYKKIRHILKTSKKWNVPITLKWEDIMNSKERIYARLAGQPVDRIPNLNIVMLFAAQHAGIPYKKFCTDYRYLVEAQTRTAEDFGLDILSTMSDSYREVSDFGIKYKGIFKRRDTGQAAGKAPGSFAVGRRSATFERF